MSKHKGSSQPNMSNPDHGKPMHEGEMPFNKGYETQMGNEDAYFPEKSMRGNNYAKLNQEIKRKDTKKLASGKFSKIA